MTTDSETRVLDAVAEMNLPSLDSISSLDAESVSAESNMSRAIGIAVLGAEADVDDGDE
jgi:hypothetical protein